MSCNSSNGCGCGNNWWWIIILIAILLCNNNGFGIGCCDNNCGC